MEIVPGVGLPVAQIGQSLTDIEAVLGLADDIQADPDRAYWHRHVPAFVAHFDRDGVVELVEVYYSRRDQEQVTLGGVQLTFRLMEDVVADLKAAGMHARHMDIGVLYDEGFFLWSMSSLNPSDLTGDPYNPDDARMVVEGVGVAPADYWSGGI